MTKPPDYYGPSEVSVPYGYLDVTCLMDSGRHGLAGPDHPYYVMRARVSQAVESNSGKPVEQLVDAVMEAL